MTFLQPLTAPIKQCFSAVLCSAIGDQYPNASARLTAVQNAVTRPESRCFDAAVRTGCVGAGLLVGCESATFVIAALNPHQSAKVRLINLAVGTALGASAYWSVLKGISE
jgi:hypothetical protein